MTLLYKLVRKNNDEFAVFTPDDDDDELSLVCFKIISLLDLPESVEIIYISSGTKSNHTHELVNKVGEPRFESTMVKVWHYNNSNGVYNYNLQEYYEKVNDNNTVTLNGEDITQFYDEQPMEFFDSYSENETVYLTVEYI